MIVWAWIGALLVGITLGLLGSGGSILTVPVLVYLVGEPDKLAIAESLGIVTLISLFGAIPFAIKRLIDWRSVVLFGLPGMAGAYGGAWVSRFVTGEVQLILFALVMLVAAVLMLRNPRIKGVQAVRRHAAWKLGGEGFAVGVLTGLVGVGGGFLIVPALVLLGGLPIHLAVGTSLAIIALKSISGFLKYVDVLDAAGQSINWELVMIFGVVGVLGSLLGRTIGAMLSQDRLRKGFAVFLVVMGGFILLQNVGSSVAAPALSTDSRAHNTMFSLFKKASTDSSEQETLSAREFVERDTEDAILIDVRTPGEVSAGHLKDAKQINLHDPAFREKVDALDRGETYYLYCRTGNRSGQAQQIMKSMGFEKVYNIGGFADLVRAGAEVAP